MQGEEGEWEGGLWEDFGGHDHVVVALALDLMGVADDAVGVANMVAPVVGGDLEAGLGDNVVVSSAGYCDLNVGEFGGGEEVGVEPAEGCSNGMD